MNHTKKALTLSIVIPCYNEESILADCLNAIKRQSILPERVIVVDNNCSDNTVQIAKRYPFVKVVRESRQGISFARNTGFDAVTSDIIARIDADTILPETWVERAIAITAQSSPETAALTGTVVIRNKPFQWLTTLFFTLTYYRLSRALSRTYILNGCNMLIKRSAWRMIRSRRWLDDRFYHEDADLSLLLRTKGYQIGFMDNKVSILARTGGSYQENVAYLMKWSRTYRYYYYKSWFVYSGLAWVIAFWDTLSRAVEEKTSAILQNIR